MKAPSIGHRAPAQPAPAAVPAFVVVAEASRHTWSELHRILLPGMLLWLVAVPAGVLAMLGRPAWAAVLLVLPCLAATGLACFVDQLVRGERPRLSALSRVDGGLALTLSLAIGAALLLIGPASLPAAGYLLGAALAVLAPVALAYGAARGRRGLAAWRGAVILVALRPSWALMVLALACLAGFAVVASAGVLAPVAPVWVLAVASAGVRRLLQENRVLE